MESDFTIRTIALSPRVWLSAAIALIVITAFLIFCLKARHETEVSSWKIPSLEGGGQRGWINRWDARLKIFSLMFFSFAVAFINNVAVLLFDAVCIACLVVASRIAIRAFLRRLSPVFSFLTFLAIVLLLTAPVKQGDTVIVLEPFSMIRLNLGIIRLILRIWLKAVIIVAVMPVVFETSPYSITVAALRKLGLPEGFTQMLLLAYRYLFVLRDEASRMYRSMKLRGFRYRTGWRTLVILGNFLGILFVRSYERTQRIYEAMTARGYRGNMPLAVKFKANWRDITLAAMWVAVASLSLIVDLLLQHGFARMI
ncbi:MAG: cobalt ECF transporter T component CbiQ [Deltaproteobacteria bacterium]|nr:cobalt ECF transporter T component CbiQ [Deltaproteobacteria bacterium]MBW2067318.1 cobalt ECF transporter T component CbiQ [Deltaproteobacteria bacterium]